MARLPNTLMPFLYPFLESPCLRISRIPRLPCRSQGSRQYESTTISATQKTEPTPTEELLLSTSRLDPSPDDYGRTIFADKCQVTVAAGSGGHGCVSFLREKFIADGPPNGGDGGTGGSIYIQAVRGETSLHKLARRRIIKAGRGKNGQGRGKGGERGEDVLVQVPVGTVIRELWRHDPAAEEEETKRLGNRTTRPQTEEGEIKGQYRRDKWILYPSAIPSDFATTDFPPLPTNRQSNLAISQPTAPIHLDLSEPMEAPMLLAAGAMGGLGNPHFVTRDKTKPRVATRGEPGLSIMLELELKILADVGFVGMPNAGKSTLLRALSNSRARIGDWAFTTLQPNIGTVVLDNNRGRPVLPATRSDGDPRTTISFADIPGLVPDAHLDRGLGLDFLRHIERAQVLAFVVDLSSPSDAVESLKQLWRELGAFEALKFAHNQAGGGGGEGGDEAEEEQIVEWRSLGSLGVRQNSARSRRLSSSSSSSPSESGATATSSTPTPTPAPPLAPLAPLPPISSKPWFVAGTKADLAGSQENFYLLQSYLKNLQGELERNTKAEHPSGRRNTWRGRLECIPISAIKGEGVERIPGWVVGLLED